MDFRKLVQKDFRELVCEEIRKLQKTVKTSFDFSYTTYEGHKSVVKIHEVLLSNIERNEDILRLYETLIKLNHNSVTQEAFNEIIDLRPYLINSPRDYTQDCLHYLGDDAQNWWFERKFTEGFKEVESLLEEHKVTEAFERYFSLETVRRYSENASEQLAYLKEVNQKIGNGFNSSSEAEFLAIIENFKFLLKLSKRHHLKIQL